MRGTSEVRAACRTRRSGWIVGGREAPAARARRGHPTTLPDGTVVNVEDQLRHIASIAGADPATANFLLANKVCGLTELVFDMHGRWIPPPKQRLARIDALDPELGSLLRRFYAAPGVAELALVQRIVGLVFGSRSAVDV